MQAQFFALPPSTYDNVIFSVYKITQAEPDSIYKFREEHFFFNGSNSGFSYNGICQGKSDTTIEISEEIFNEIKVKTLKQLGIYIAKIHVTI